MHADIKILQKKQFLFGSETPFSLEDSHFVILPIPMEKTTSYMQGTQFAPQKIIEASTQLEFFDTELKKELHHKGIYTDWSLGLNPIKLNSQSSETIVQQIYQHTKELLKKNKCPISIGGEHTISVGLVPAFVEKYQDDITLLHIDAHADLKESYEGNILSHACVMKRLLGSLPIVSLGIRSIDQDEYKLIQKSKNIDVFFSEEIHSNPNWIHDVLKKIKTKYIYLSFDLDGLDPSVIPGLGTPEPGGLTWFQALHLLKEACKKFTLVGADFNEVCPSSVELYSEITCSKLIYKTIGYAQSF